MNNCLCFTCFSRSTHSHTKREEERSRDEDEIARMFSRVVRKHSGNIRRGNRGEERRMKGYECFHVLFAKCAECTEHGGERKGEERRGAERRGEKRRGKDRRMIGYVCFHQLFAHIAERRGEERKGICQLRLSDVVR